MFRLFGLILIVTCITVWYFFKKIYTYLLHTYFVRDDTVVYDYFLENFIQVVSNENYFMNYGFWEDSTHTLLDANRRLIQLLLEKTKIKGKQHVSLLDVGCGYGIQDKEWAEAELFDSSNRLTAIDISPIQIKYAKKHHAHPSVTYQIGDATKLDDMFQANSFDCVLNVESAFHYKDRQSFFNSINTLLKKDGTFVISDIVIHSDYKPSFFSRLFLRVFSDFLHVPEINLVTTEQWKGMMERAGLEVEELQDITPNTFLPYYSHFFKTYIQRRGFPDVIASLLYRLFDSVQPFSYVIAVCRKKQ